MKFGKLAQQESFVSSDLALLMDLQAASHTAVLPHACILSMVCLCCREGEGEVQLTHVI